MKTYTFYKDGQKYETNNLAEFSQEHGLIRQKMREVDMGTRRQHRGWTAQPTSNDLEETLALAAGIAETHGGTYEKRVLARIAKMREAMQGVKPVEVLVDEARRDMRLVDD